MSRILTVVRARHQTCSIRSSDWRISVGLGLVVRILRLLEMGGRVRQVAGAGRVASAHRALLEVSFQDITSRKRIFA